MNLIFINAIELLVILLVSSVVLKSNIHGKINKIFFIFAILVALWSLFVNVSANTPEIIFSRLVDVFGISVAMLLLIFILNYPESDNRLSVKYLQYVIVTINFLLSPLILFTPLIVSSIEYTNNLVIPINGVWAWLYFLVLFGQIIVGAIIMLYKFFWVYKKGSEKRRQIFFVIFGIIVSALIILLSFIPFFIDANNTYLIDFMAPLAVMVFIFFIAYGIMKGGLFDVRLAIVRSVTYSMLIVTLASIYAGLTFAASSLFSFGQASFEQTVFSVVISLGLVFLFQPLKKFFDKITNRIFYKDNYNTDDFFAKLNKVLGFTTDLRGLLERTAIEIGTTLKGDQAFFYINTDDGHYISAGTPKHKQLPQSDATQLNKVVKSKNEIIIASLMNDADPINRLMTSHRIELILPLMQGSDVIGYLCLGEHKTSSYTNRDIKVLNTISNELIIAIQNALAVQEIREFNITLQQRIANATRELRSSNAQLRHLDKAKDEFLSMASHQLRTPLTSVKGYISMVLEGDTGKVNADQKKLLNEAFVNSEHMVGLINDFLNVSRIQTGKFTMEKVPTDLCKVVTQELESLKPSATSRQLKFDFKPPVDFPILDIDEGKIRQVIMNFSDNSLYYSKQDTKITINLSVEGENAVFTVKDTGIGVPKSEQDELFTKFYRASNAKKQRPDGTGVGLFLAKKIIDGHGGKIIFESVEGKGSTFGFSLPITKLVAVSDTNNLDNQDNN